MEGDVQAVRHQPVAGQRGKDGVRDARGDGTAGGQPVQSVRQVHRIGGGDYDQRAERDINVPRQVHLSVERDEEGSDVVVQFHARLPFRIQPQESDAQKTHQDLDDELFTCGNAVGGFLVTFR